MGPCGLTPILVLPGAWWLGDREGIKKPSGEGLVESPGDGVSSGVCWRWVWRREGVELWLNLAGAEWGWVGFSVEFEFEV